MFKGIYVWKKESGNYLSHRQGLTQEQIDAFKSLQPGDRLMVSPNNYKQQDSDPDMRITIYRKNGTETII